MDIAYFVRVLTALLLVNTSAAQIDNSYKYLGVSDRLPLPIPLGINQQQQEPSPSPAPLPQIVNTEASFKPLKLKQPVQVKEDVQVPVIILPKQAALANQNFMPLSYQMEPAVKSNNNNEQLITMALKKKPKVKESLHTMKGSTNPNYRPAKFQRKSGNQGSETEEHPLLTKRKALLLNRNMAAVPEAKELSDIKPQTESETIKSLKSIKSLRTHNFEPTSPLETYKTKLRKNTLAMLNMKNKQDNGQINTSKATQQPELVRDQDQIATPISVPEQSLQDVKLDTASSKNTLAMLNMKNKRYNGQTAVLAGKDDPKVGAVSKKDDDEDEEYYYYDEDDDEEDDEEGSYFKMDNEDDGDDGDDDEEEKDDKVQVLKLDMQPIQVNKIFDDFLQSGPPNVHVQRINTIKSEKSGTNSAPQVVPIEQVGVPLGFFGLGDANKMAADAAKVAAEAAIKYILGKVKTPESTEEIIETELSLAKACIGPSDQERGMTNLKLQKKISKLDQYQELDEQKGRTFIKELTNWRNPNNYMLRKLSYVNKPEDARQERLRLDNFERASINERNQMNKNRGNEPRSHNLNRKLNQQSWADKPLQRPFYDDTMARLSYKSNDRHREKYEEKNQMKRINELMFSTGLI
jgi:hypothetical protein